jgi:6-phosphogluconate dehydrogenase
MIDRTPGQEKLAGTAEDGHRCCGPNGAGHFAKMVHDGIEYAIMAAYAEGMNILKHANVGKQSQQASAEMMPLRHPELYQCELNLADIAQCGGALQKEGAESFVKSWDETMDVVAKKAQAYK